VIEIGGPTQIDVDVNAHVEEKGFAPTAACVTAWLRSPGERRIILWNTADRSV
jgi:hypothetical protein